MRLSRGGRRREKRSHEADFARWGQHCKGCAYVDDIALAGADEYQTAAAVRELVAILRRMGMPAVDKDGTWAPRRQQKFLGVWFDTIKEHPVVLTVLAVDACCS